MKNKSILDEYHAATGVLVEQMRQLLLIVKTSIE